MSPGILTICGRVDYPGFSLDVDLSVAAGDLVAIVGPNGCGKTTLLRAVAGLTPLTAGTVSIDGVTVDDPEHGRWMPPEKRSTGFVFHDHRLFSRSNVVDNVAFGLRAGGAKSGPARRRALEWLNRMEAGDLATHPVPSLSAGEAQRVALARALAPEPSVLLLDEPFSALDDPTRRWMQHILTDDLGETNRPDTTDTPDGFVAGAAGPTRLVVTHDPTEALTLGSRVVILENGRVVQDDAPAGIARHPASPYAAALVGVNVLRGTARAGTVTLDTGGELHTASDVSGPVTALVHPHAVGLFDTRPAGTPRNIVESVVDGVDREENRVRVRLRGPLPLIAEVTPTAVEDLDITPGRTVWATVKATEVDVRPR